MRRILALVCLFAVGCGNNAKLDTSAAQEFVQRMNRSPELLIVEGPEYAEVPTVPKHGSGDKSPDKSAACGVRIKFRTRDENRTTTDDWIVWVASDHKAVDWTGNAKGDNWRPFVQSLAKK